MTKKHFIQLAALLSNARNLQPELNQQQLISWLTVEMAHIFKNDNPKFDTAKFLKACK